MPDPRQEGYRDALLHWIKHFIRVSHGKAFVLFTNYKLMQEVGGDGFLMFNPYFDRRYVMDPAECHAVQDFGRGIWPYAFLKERSRPPTHSLPDSMASAAR